MVFENGEFNATGKSIDSCQPAQSAQADMSRNFSLSSKFSACQGTILPYKTVGCLTNGLVQSQAWAIFFHRIDDSHCNRIHSSLSTVHFSGSDHVGKQPVAWKEYCSGKKNSRKAWLGPLLPLYN